jgi:hypothetical protein
MLVYQAFRYELAPTAAQRVVLANHAGAAVGRGIGACRSVERLGSVAARLSARSSCTGCLLV